MRTITAKKEKLNNKGFSLVEVLLCIAIISIVCVAVMNGFSIAARLNVKADSVQRVTAFAQKLLEECRNTDDVEEILAEYTGSMEEPVTDSSAYSALSEEQKKLCTEEMFTVATYMMRNVTITDGGQYDVQIITNPLPYSQFVTDKTDNPKVEDANTFGTPNVNQIEDTKNPVIKDEISRYDNAAAEELQVLLPAGIKDGTDLQRDALKAAMQKAVTITIMDAGADAIAVSAQAVYSTAYNEHTVEKRYMLYQASYPLEKQTKTILDNVTNTPTEIFESYKKGGNIFIFAEAMNDISRNTITIRNESRVPEPLTVSLIRGGSLGTANFNSVTLEDAASFTVYADTAQAGIEPTGLAAVHNMIFHSNIKGVQTDYIRQQDIDNTLHGTASAYRCYDMTVNIYEPNTGKLVVSLTTAQEKQS